MTTIGWIQIAVTLGVVLGTAFPLGAFLARVHAGEPTLLGYAVGPLERGLYRLMGIEPESEQTWGRYAASVLLFNALGLFVVFALQLAQGALPMNPQGLGPVTWHSALDTAISFATNTNWQGYGGETTMSYLTQMLGLTVQNFMSAATGMAIVAALARGFSRRISPGIGSFWVDVVRMHLYVLLPLSIVLALILASQGVVQTFEPYATARLADPVESPDGSAVLEQTIALGPAASQVAIKQLGTNGGGFFNVNSAHPFENPTPLSDFAELWAILAIPAALCVAFGRLVGDRRQGIALLAAMTAILVPALVATALAEGAGNPVLANLGLVGGNLEGKEVRFGVAASSMWAVFTTAASNGSVNAMHDSFTPLGGLVPMALMQLGEVVFGGAGSGLYGMVVFAIIAVFVAGLMVGRTPEYLGKKIEAFEIQMAAIAILAPCAVVLLGTALAIGTDVGRSAIWNAASPHGFSEVLYAFSSAGNNNGSAFAGLGANTPFYNLALAFAMLIGRYAVALPVLAIAGSLAAKKTMSAGPGTLPTHGPLFVGLLVATVLLVGALTFLPALALGPIVEHLRLWGG